MTSTLRRCGTLHLGRQTELSSTTMPLPANGLACRARRHANVHCIATECGMARGDPVRVLAAHARAAKVDC
jgi:hypothetical protein